MEPLVAGFLSLVLLVNESENIPSERGPNKKSIFPGIMPVTLLFSNMEAGVSGNDLESGTIQRAEACKKRCGEHESPAILEPISLESHTESGNCLFHILFFFRERQSRFVDTSFIYLVEVHVRTWRDSHSLVSAFAKYRLRTRRAKRRSRHEQKRTSSTLCLRGMFASSVHWVFAQGHAPTQVIRPPLLSRVRFVRSPVTNES